MIRTIELKDVISENDSLLIGNTFNNITEFFINLRKLVETYSGMCKRKIMSSVLYDYEDLLQEAYVTLLECKNKFIGNKGNFLAYFATSLRNNLGQIVIREVKEFKKLNFDSYSIYESVYNIDDQNTIQNKLTDTDLYFLLDYNRYKNYTKDEKDLLTATFFLGIVETRELIDYLNITTNRKWSDAKVSVVKKSLREILKNSI